MKFNLLAAFIGAALALKGQTDQTVLVETDAEGISGTITSGVSGLKETRSGAGNTAQNVAGKLGLGNSCVMKKINVYHVEAGEDDYPYVPNCGFGTPNGRFQGV